MKVFIGADHRGFKLKEKIKSWLSEWGYEFNDEGARELDLKDDYTTFASRVALKVSKNKGSMGILACGSGVGVDVTANKFDGIRASVGKESGQIKLGREDDNMNVLVIAADFTNETEAKNMIKTFLETEFSGKARHKKRQRDIERIEKTN